MSDRIEVKGSDRGRVWVFDLDVEPEKLKAYKGEEGRAALQAALGAETLDPAHAEVFDVSDLAGLGLAAYLQEGYGVPDDQLDGLRARLDGLKGAVVVLSAKAFGGDNAVLKPRAPLRLVASLSEDRPPVAFAPLPSGAAAGTLAGPPVPDQSVSKPRILMSVLLGIAALIILVIAFAVF